MNKNPLPKTEFLKNQAFVTAHNRLIELPEFQRAIEVAKSQYQRTLTGMSPDIFGQSPRPDAATISSMAFQRLQGVDEFLSFLCNLAEPYPMAPQGPDDGKLIEIPRTGRPRN